MAAALRGAAAALLVAAAAANFGVDVSAPVDAAAAACMVKSGQTFAIVRAWHNFGTFDENAPASIRSLWSGGMAHVDAYLFPCARMSGALQIGWTIKNLTDAGAKIGQLWFDIETNPDPSCAWRSNAASNCALMGELVTAAKSAGVSAGVYASKHMWDDIMGGNACTIAAGLPLWYADYDGQPNFDAYVPFGGWAKPAMKQYADGPALCGVGTDRNWYPA